ncbi:hypothetical protein E1B28_011539 [Marasmius oreades]|uniref:Uncharacterized protein n=1 Tax=Marasmius oreades TaxID=181124 RepID=A0A9P7RUA7_9AGAR|nr:uncharacterized protein E1B28_011539 [Marasmius oreades]KAG7089906.1 hypothetical protein E1B28_011539 [Marasmius oreades]
MLSITKSISIMFLVGAAANVVAAPSPQPAELSGSLVVDVDRANSCVIKKPNGATLSIKGFANILLLNDLHIDGCSKEKLEKCKDMETDDDRRRAIEICPELETSGQNIAVTVLEKCMKEGMEECRKNGKCHDDDRERKNDDDDDDDKRCKDKACKKAVNVATLAKVDGCPCAKKDPLVKVDAMGIVS